MSIDLGKYQNEVVSLSSLNIKDYERIFKLFKSSIDDKDFHIYNLLNRIDFPEIDSQYIDYYNVEKRTALTIVSYNIYGDIKSWWIIYLLNKDQFEGAPFYAKEGTTLKYITDPFRTAIYQDITTQTIYQNRHY
jgi:hypothetical protein